MWEEDNMDLKDQRVDYNKFELLEAHAGQDPFELFSRWFKDASETEPEPNIMIISTVHDNQPQTRVVLLKEVLNNEFVFYTNYASTKGKALAENPHISILFFWRDQQRQVRIQGVARKVSTEISDEYFYSRPVESQIGAIASTQSELLDDRGVLEDKYQELTAYYKDHNIERPEHWGGYAIKPESFEFWQGRESRLHDRLCFSADGHSWVRKRLYP
ncbi:MAG: pyridoxamine 5'-phosphate oxidase [Bacteroidia bacterium]|jgi:pyridoxamine 5'-phosphate oxidase